MHRDYRRALAHAGSLARGSGYRAPADGRRVAVVAEEMGFIIALSVVALYIGIMWQGIQVAKTAPDNFGKIVAAGIITWITFQAVVNIMAMLSLLPLTGIPLPFISYGSTSMATLLAAVGILINISRQTVQR